ncbi:MAG: TlpA family protein disulfide reductase [Actinomycetota bacterium]
MKADLAASKSVVMCAVTAVVVLASCGGPATTTETDAQSAPASSPSEGGSGTGIPAPDFSFETFEGESFSLAEQRGTPVVLNFWESW